MEEVLKTQAPNFLLKPAFVEQLAECDAFTDHFFIKAFGSFGYPPWEEEARGRFGKRKAAEDEEDIMIEEPAKRKTKNIGGKAKKGKEKAVAVKAKGTGTAGGRWEAIGR